jgi:hypothetical protein
MRRATLITLLLPALFLVDNPARAGQRMAYEVFIDTAARIAYGSMGDVRNSLDTKQYIECTHWVSAGGEQIFCAAQDAAGIARACYVPAADVPRFRAVVASISDSSNLYFTWSASNLCTYIQVRNSSQFAPRVP